MDALALIFTVAALIRLGLVFLCAALICQFTSITNMRIGR